MADLVGKTLKNRYKVVESLGRGGMADVYKVWDEERAVYLAMKVLRQDLAQDPIFLRRFQREAKALAGLQHPHIVRFYGLERDDLLAFLLMEYVDGVSLQAEILRSEGKPLPMEHIREVMEAVCSALHYAHHQGLVHCDIKPGNILIDKHGQIYLTDFGIARGMDAATSTMVGIGTPAYMAPELIKGQDPTPQTDIYALGIVLYEMLTGGERPFTGERATIMGTTADKVRWEHLKLEPAPILQFNPHVNSNLQAIIEHCLQKESKTRFENTIELSEAICDSNIAFHSQGTNIERQTENAEKNLRDKKKHREKSYTKKKSSLKYVLSISMTSIFLLFIGIFLFEYRNPQSSKGLEVTETIISDSTRIPTSVVTVIPSVTPTKISYPVITTQNIEQLEKVGSWDIPEEISTIEEIKFSKDGAIVVLGLSGKGIFLWYPEEGLINDIASYSNSIRDVTISEDLSRVAYTNGEGTVYVFNLDKFSKTNYGNDNDWFECVAISPSNKTIAVGTADKNIVHVWNLETGEEITSFSGSKNEIVAVEFSPDGKFIAAGTDYNWIKLWNLTTGELVRTFRGHDSWIRDIDISQNSSLLASASSDQTVKIWNIENGELLKTLSGHQAWVMGVQFSPDADMLISYSDDRSIKIWDVDSGNLLSEISSYYDNSSNILYSTKASFSPEGNAIYTYTDDGTFDMWAIN